MASEALIHAGRQRGYDELVNGAYSKHFSKAAMTQMSSSFSTAHVKAAAGAAGDLQGAACRSSTGLLGDL
jgi:hypothetical protein